jgi:hypothetical protein
LQNKKENIKKVIIAAIASRLMTTKMTTIKSKTTAIGPLEATDSGQT